MRSDRVSCFGPWPQAILLAALAFFALSPVAPAEVIERIVAVVDGRPLLLSELLALQRVRGAENPAAVRDALVDEWLMFREASRLPQLLATAEEEERVLARLKEGLGPGPSVADAELRRLVRRQTAILKYVDFRFRPQVRVDEAAVERAPAGDPGGTPSEDDRAARRADLEARDLDQRIEDWVKELRRGAEIRYNP